MGLSEEERKRNVIHCVNAMAGIEQFTIDSKNDNFDKINKILKNLWYSLCGKYGNSSYWFAGASSDNNTLKQDDIFGSAIIASYFSDHPQKGEDIINYEGVDDSFGPGTKEWWDYTSKFKPTALSLLSNYNSWGRRKNQERDIYFLFKYIENYIYNVNRYQDKLSKSYQRLTKQICKLKGLLYNVMSNDSIYFKAYASEVVLDKVLPDYHTDPINKWFMDESLHHALDLKNLSTEELFEALSLVQKLSYDSSNHKMKSNDRIVLILKFCGSKFHYKVQQLKLLKLIEKHNENEIKDKINLKQIKCLCEKASSERLKQEEENKIDYHWGCDLTGQNYYKNSKEYKKRNKNE